MLLRFGFTSSRRAEKITGPPAAVSTMYPADGAVNQQLDIVLSWSKPSQAQKYKIFFGTSVETIVQVGDIEGQLAKTYVPEDLELDGTYYWRVDAVNSYGTTTGVVVSFSTWAAADIWTDEATGIPWTDDAGNYIPHERT